MPNLDTLFLDRDGVINVKLENRYVRSFEEFEFISGVPEAISNLSKVFKRILVVTNQQGIGKGIMSEEQLKVLHKYMLNDLQKFDGVINAIYFCPHLINDNCKCRKPDVGMLKQALVDYPDIDLENSYLVGDSETDIQAGEKMGLKTIKVDNTYTLSKWAERLIAHL